MVTRNRIAITRQQLYARIVPVKVDISQPLRACADNGAKFGRPGLVAASICTKRTLSGTTEEGAARFMPERDSTADSGYYYGVTIDTERPGEYRPLDKHRRAVLTRAHYRIIRRPCGESDTTVLAVFRNATEKSRLAVFLRESKVGNADAFIIDKRRC